MGDVLPLKADDSVSVESVAKAAYTLAHVEKFITIMETASKIYAGLPKEVRETIDLPVKNGLMDGLDERAMNNIAVGIAHYPSDVVHLMSTMLMEIRSYICVWGEEGSAPCGMLDDADVQLIEEMVVFSQGLGKRSRRQLLQFLEAANDNDRGFLVIKAKGNESEIRVHSRLSPETANELDLN